MTTVEREMMDAYSDCHELKAGERNLGWKASEYVSKWEAMRMFHEYVKGYNEFTWDLLVVLPSDCQIRLAREGSVCIYVKFANPTNKLHFHKLGEYMKADEISEEGEEVRYWWD